MIKSIRLWVLMVCMTGPAYGQSGLEITPLTENTFVYTTYRKIRGVPFPSNGLYVVTDQGAALIDTPWDPDHYQTLLDSIKSRHGLEVVLTISTHWHEDRTGGIAYYRQKGIQTIASQKTDSFLVQQDKARPEFVFKKDTLITIGGLALKAQFPGEGHTIDNVVVWIDQEKVLYGGCLVKSYEANNLGYVEEANLRAWPATIRNLQATFPQAEHVIPGHEDWSKNESLQRTLQLLLEKQ